MRVAVRVAVRVAKRVAGDALVMLDIAERVCVDMC